MLDVAIIGCGVIGAAAAYELSHYPLQTAIFEAENDVADCTTKANSAILHAGYDPEPGTRMARLNVEGSALAKEICARLDVPYLQCGSLVLALSPEELPHLQKLYENGIANGVPGIRLLSAEETLAMEPNLAPTVVGALYAPSAAIVSPWDFALAMAEVAVRNGVELHRSCPVTHIEKTADGWALTTPDGIVETRYIINAAGISAQAVHDMAAPHKFTIQPTRGEYYLLDKSEGSRVHHVIFQCPNENGKGVLVAPTVHGNLIVGPNADPVEGDDTACTAAGLACVEVMPYSGGLTRNIVQCLQDFDIPLYLSHTIVDIQGKARVEKATVAKVDENRRPIPGTEMEFDVDTILLSVGLIPENELTRQAGIPMDPHTKGAVVYENMETGIPGVFACGNVVHVHDLVDFVSGESDLAGASAAAYVLNGEASDTVVLDLVPGNGVGYTVPQRVRPADVDRSVNISFRVRQNYGPSQITVACGGRQLARFKRQRMAPGEMEHIALPKVLLEKADGPLTVAVEEVIAE